MKGAKGQGVLMTVLLLGILMATVIIFGAKRQADVSLLTGRMDASQAAAEVLSAASKRVQSIYANEAACDPNSFNSRISNLPKLGTDPNALGFGGSGLAFAVAQASYTAGSSQRYNICTPSGATGCRQIAINLENLVYIVTVGNVIAMKPDTNTPPKDCPQDVNVHLSVAIGGSVYNQWSTLLNVCTLRSCNHNVLPAANSDAGDFTALTPSSFDGASATIPAGSLQTTACVVGGITLPARYYGVITKNVNTQVNSDDIRWARRYLDTGGAGIGDVSNLFVTGGATPVPTSCPVANSSGQCVGKACVPVFDLNTDYGNSETDLGILELYLRGYLLSLPVTNLR